MNTVLVTGASGFVGRHLVARLLTDGVAVRCAVRDAGKARIVLGDRAELVQVGAVDGATDWRGALHDVRAVFHLAARAHILEEKAAEPLQAFLRVNYEGTRALARQAAEAGVGRFVLVSSIKVNGESSGTGAYRADDEPAPVDPYGVSKWRAELALREICRPGVMEGVIVRPPLVYGPGVGANFMRLVRLVDRGVPLPLGKVENRRSLVSVWNLCDLLIRCSHAGSAAGRTFMVSDGRDFGTPELIRALAEALDRPARLVNVPVSWLRLAARLTGGMAEYKRLCSSLVIDMSDTLQALDWQPPLSVEDSLRRTAIAYRQGHQNL